ncbi:MAG: plasmid pRiA4b ORF-3 family protein [Chloroflexota bacterium]
MAPPDTIYQLRVTILDTDPPVWRRVQAPTTITLFGLHLVLQATMGWENQHLYRFDIHGTEYGEPDPDGLLEFRNARRNKLSSKVKVGDTFTYEYDFGDSWEHEILVEQESIPHPEVSYPVCVAGERACPPEDCGGPMGFEDLLEAISDPRHEEHEDMLVWIGYDFDPSAFDIGEANARLAGGI